MSAETTVMNCIECGTDIEQNPGETPVEAVIEHFQEEHDYFSNQE